MAGRTPTDEAFERYIALHKLPGGRLYCGEIGGPVREFETGATRDSDDAKHEYAGFNSPLVEKRFAEYMTLHRKQADGQIRSSSNWKRGIPIHAYLQSLHRHYIDLWLHLDGYPGEAVDQDVEAVLCALRFNVNGMLHEIIKERLSKTSTST